MSESRIPIEKATKEQLLEALKGEFYWPQIKERIESRLYHDKVRSLIDETGRLLDESDKFRQVAGQPFDFEKAKKWTAIMDKIDRINTKLSKLQGE